MVERVAGQPSRMTDEQADVKQNLAVAGKGEDICPSCGGTGRQEDRDCAECGGSGKVTVEIAGG